MTNESPPPLGSNIDYHPPQPKQGLSTGAKWGIGCGSGCLVALLVAGVIAYAAWTAFKKNVIDAYTSDAPVAIEAPVVDEATAKTVVARFDSFREAMEQGKETPPLTLTGNEINILIHHHPDWKSMAGHGAVAIEGDQLKGQISLPLGEISGLLKGRYLNGEATIRIALIDGVVEGYIDDFKFAGKSPPPEILNELKSANIFEDAQTDPELKQLLKNVESIEISEGQLIIVPKPAADRNSSGGSGTTPATPAEKAESPVEA